MFRGNDLIGETSSRSLSDPAAPQGRYEYAVRAVYDDGVLALPVKAEYDNGGVQTYSLPFSEDFTGGMKPANWQVQKLRAAMKDDYLWRFDNWYELPITGEGFDADYASVNSMYAGYGRVTTRLVSPPLQATGLSDDEQVMLDFDMDLNEGSSTRARLDFSTDGGDTWETWEYLSGYTDDDLDEGQTSRPEHVQMDVTSIFDTDATIMLGWYYNGLQSKHLAIDNVRVSRLSATGIENIGPATADGSQSATATATRVTAPDGRTLRLYDKHIGTRQALDGLSAGLYIVNGHAVVVK